ncbi:MAG: acetylornithine deacetylase [Deltaproteobacteria bacterium]|nr:acetylornithine deacetylase [Deltaproteobacteria bacterium]
MRARVLEHLQRLVAFDTRNPPRRMDTAGIFGYLAAHMPRDARVDVKDLGDGCVYLHARRGETAELVNVHVDTVPAAPGWTRDPHALHVAGTRVVGLGACDIKGAAAAMVAMLPQVEGPFALLFSSDEEAGDSRCVRTFLREHPVPQRVFVAEPTRCRAVTAHRGLATASGTFRGVPGHASAARALRDSALHELTRWAARALEWAELQEGQGAEELRGARFNLGFVEGGSKPNMIAGEARVRFGVRPPPGRAPASVVDEVCALAPDPARVQWERGFVAPPLPARGDASRAVKVARELGLPGPDGVDFWTEAALFSEAGADAVVFGPGDIAQAHTADEWVEIDQLMEAARMYGRILGAGIEPERS